MHLHSNTSASTAGVLLAAVDYTVLSGLLNCGCGIGHCHTDHMACGFLITFSASNKYFDGNTPIAAPYWLETFGYMCS